MLTFALLAALAPAPAALPLLHGPTAGGEVAAPPGLVEIKGGRTKIGTKPKDIEPLIRQTNIRKLVGETGQHEVKIDDFYLMVTEVTNEQFETFVQATGSKPPQSWGRKAIDDATIQFNKDEGERIRQAKEAGIPYERGRFDASAWWEENWQGAEWEVPNDKRNHPVEYVSYEDARGYARWAGLRLMTEFEYQRAGRMNSDYVFPWGDEFEAKKFAATLENGRDVSSPVGSFPDGATKDGIYDLIGNVWEWTSSPYTAYPNYKPLKVKFGERRQARTERCVTSWNGSQRVVVGGSFKNNWIAGRLSVRRATDRDQATDAMGFRCAASTRPGLDVSESILFFDIPSYAIPEGVEYNTSQVVAMDRWSTQEGTAGVSNYNVIGGYEYVLYVPIKEVASTQLKQLRDTTLENGPMHFGVLSSTVDLIEPELAAGSYLVAWRSAGETKEKKDDKAGDDAEVPVVEEEQPADIWDASIDSLVFYDTEGRPVATMEARDLKYDRLKPGSVSSLTFRPSEKEIEAGLRPHDTIKFMIPLPGKSQRGFWFDLRVKTKSGALGNHDSWRR